MANNFLKQDFILIPVLSIIVAPILVVKSLFKHFPQEDMFPYQMIMLASLKTVVCKFSVLE